MNSRSLKTCLLSYKSESELVQEDISIGASKGNGTPTLGLRAFTWS